jgi:tRNA modification GTPase
VPNAGKSSLFNALVGASRAIVTDVPGTTRDLLTERVDVAGLPITLVDTAGQRDARDAIEVEGVARAKQAQRIAALTLVVLDRASPIGDEETRLIRGAVAPSLFVASKSDLPPAWDAAEISATTGGVIEVSAVTGAGLPALRDRIVSSLVSVEALRDTPEISNVRHLGLVEQALASVEHALVSLDAAATEELLLADLGAARRALEEITGARTPDDLLRHIFERFCIGK